MNREQIGAADIGTLPPAIVRALEAYDDLLAHFTRDLSGVDAVRVARTNLLMVIARALDALTAEYEGICRV